MKESFKEVRFRHESLLMIDHCNKIIDNYREQNLRLTLRQLYYQLVTRNIVPNVERSYKNLSSLVSDARLAGLMDWEAIEDRIRVPKVPNEFDNLSELIEAAKSSYRLPRWRGQDNYCELWVEKDALAGVLSPLARTYHVTLMVNRGYSSQSAMYEAANRFKSRRVHGSMILFYLGDHDPSGEDMVRDIQERMTMFGADCDVRKLALNMDQIDKYKPPPNPAKVTDPRARAYIEKYGESSWEVDALPPEVLATIIKKVITGIIDKDRMDIVISQEQKDKEKLDSLIQENN